MKDGDVISAGGVNLTAVFTPGHTPGSTCYFTEGHLFSGDTLFPGGPGKSGSPEKFKQLVESITTKLFTLGDDVNVFPGHGETDGSIRESKAEYAVSLRASILTTCTAMCCGRKARGRARQGRELFPVRA